jgi:acetolactate synthase I/II/III large subunit
VAEKVTVELPEGLAQQVRTVAARTQRSFAEVLVDWIRRAGAEPALDQKDEVEDALHEMLDSQGPYVLEVLVPYQEHVLPMIPSGHMVRDIIKA